MLIHRRGFLTGLVSLLTAPAIVHAQNIMPVRLILPDYDWDSFNEHPKGLQYQWNSMLDVEVFVNYPGWDPVPASLYKKKFSIKGDVIEHGGCVLMQKLREPVQSIAYPWPESFNDPDAVKMYIRDDRS